MIVISRFVETFAPGAQEREIVVGFAEDRVGGNGGFVVRFRLALAAQTVVDDAKEQLAFGVGRREFHGLSDVLLGGGEVSERHEREAEHPVRVGVVRIELHGATEGIDGSSRVFQPQVDHSQFAKRRDVAGVLLDDHLEEFTGGQVAAGGEGFLGGALEHRDVAVQLGGVAADSGAVLGEG